MQDLKDERNKIIKTLDKANELLRVRSQDYATSERDYRVALRVKILELKAENYAATLISDLARGDEQVANLKMRRDVTADLYKSCLEAININKLKLRVVQEEIAQEWNSGGK